MQYSYFLDKIAKKDGNQFKINHRKYPIAKQTIEDLFFLKAILLKGEEVIDISLWIKYITPFQINRVLSRNKEENNKEFEELLISVQEKNKKTAFLKFNTLLLNFDDDHLEININSIFDNLKQVEEEDSYIKFNNFLVNKGLNYAHKRKKIPVYFIDAMKKIIQSPFISKGNKKNIQEAIDTFQWLNIKRNIERFLVAASFLFFFVIVYMKNSKNILSNPINYVFNYFKKLNKKELL